MNFMYFFSVICLLGYAIVYSIVVVFVSFFLASCDGFNNSTDASLGDKKVIAALILPNTGHIEKEKIHIDDNNHLETNSEFANNLQKILRENNPEIIITQQSPIIPFDWQVLYNRYMRLSASRQHEIAMFYKKKLYKPVWVNDKGILNNNARQIKDLLNQEIFLTTPIKGDFLPDVSYAEKKAVTEDLILQKDFEFTFNLLPALEKVRNGITITKGAGISENNGYKPFDFQNTLLNFANGHHISEIDNMTHFHPQYKLLKEHIKILNDLKAKGGYVSVPYGKTLKIGMTDANIPIIRKRLMQSGFITYNTTSDIYDNDLEKQIIAFQASRGIKPDGIIGSAVYRSFNQSINQDLITILSNLERIRRAPDISSMDKHIQVNVPEMALYAKENNHTILSMKTIVGRKDRKTPIFNDLVKYVDFNPYWHIPHSLATKDILPKLKSNPSYLTTQGVKVFRNNVLMNARNINWKLYSETNFPFTLRQDPGKHNALGTVKFIFPNEYAVYLHDTPAKGIFYNDVRSESSGCIRVSKPKELAFFLLNNLMTEQKINQIFASHKNKIIYTSNPVPISIEYLTAFVRDGVLNIRPDIYEYDKPLINTLIAQTQ